MLRGRAAREEARGERGEMPDERARSEKLLGIHTQNSVWTDIW